MSAQLDAINVCLLQLFNLILYLLFISVLPYKVYYLLISFLKYYNCYKVIQLFEVTCFIAGQIKTKGQSAITDVNYNCWIKCQAGQSWWTILTITIPLMCVSYFGIINYWNWNWIWIFISRLKIFNFIYLS